MSVRILSMVWDGYPRGGTELLALLALADWSDDNGRCWPAMASIARKTRLSEKQARRLVHSIIESGYLNVTENAQGGSTSRRYQINLKRLATPPTHGSPPVDGRPPAGVPDPSHPREATPPTHGSRTVMYTSRTVNPVDSLESPTRKKGKSSTPEDPKGFSECWAAYPKRSGGNSRAEAVKAYRARLKAGAEPDVLLTGVKRYAAFIAATGKTGTPYVKQASSFFGPGEHWLETWALPTEAAGTAGGPDFFKGAI